MNDNDIKNIDACYCEEVIISNQLTRGDGTNMNPIRIVTQVFSKDGVLIAEHDPRADCTFWNYGSLAQAIFNDARRITGDKEHNIDFEYTSYSDYLRKLNDK